MRAIRLNNKVALTAFKVADWMNDSSRECVVTAFELERREGEMSLHAHEWRRWKLCTRHILLPGRSEMQQNTTQHPTEQGQVRKHRSRPAARTTVIMASDGSMKKHKKSKKSEQAPAEEVAAVEAVQKGVQARCTQRTRSVEYACTLLLGCNTTTCLHCMCSLDQIRGSAVR